MPPTQRSKYRFGHFVLDPATGELTRDGMPLKLRPQAFKVLQVLVERPGELITRDELRDLLWGKDTFVDFDQGLNFCVREIRKYLGDGAGEPTYVQTLPRRGYRFLAPVERVEVKAAEVHAVPTETPPEATAQAMEEADTSTTTPAAPVPQVSGKRSRLPIWVGAVAAVLVIGLLATWWWESRKPRMRYPARLVVLPFSNLTGNPNQDYLVRGVVEEITAQLGSMNPESLVVIGRTSAEAVANKGLRVDQIASELDVDYLVEGSVRQEKNWLRITVQLIRTADMAHVWAESYDRDAMKLFTVEQEVAMNVSREVNFALGRANKQQMRKRTSDNEEAMDAYTRGRDATTKYTRAVSGIAYDGKADELYQTAEQLLTKATVLDPQFALAYAELARVYSIGPVTAGRALPVWDRAREAMEKAQQLDPTLPEAYEIEARIALNQPDANFDEVRESLRHLHELGTRTSNSVMLEIQFEELRGNFGQALELAKEYVKMEPMSESAVLALSNAYYLHKNYDAALALSSGLLRKDPNVMAAIMFQMRQQFMKGDTRRWMESYLLMLGYLSRFYPNEGTQPALNEATLILHRQGTNGFLEYLKNEGRETFVQHSGDQDPAFRLMMIGDKEEALTALAALSRNKMYYFRLRQFLRDPIFEPLHDDPRFKQLVAVVKFPAS